MLSKIKFRVGFVMGQNCSCDTVSPLEVRVSFLNQDNCAGKVSPVEEESPPVAQAEPPIAETATMMLLLSPALSTGIKL